MSEKYDSRGRPYHDAAWGTLTELPQLIDLLAALSGPGVDSYLIWDDSESELAFVPTRSEYAGRVDENGDEVSLPAGWTSAEQAAGQIRVTHSLTLDPDAYVVVVTQHDQIDAGHFIWVVNSAEYFDVFFRDVDNAAESEAFGFIMRETG